MRFSLLLGVGLPVVLSQDCGVTDKLDCGYFGIDQQGCQDKGCCWQPSNQVRDFDTPWCFYPDGGGGGDCSDYNLVADGPGFTDDFYNLMYQNYRDNLNVEDCGAVVAVSTILIVKMTTNKIPCFPAGAG